MTFFCRFFFVLVVLIVALPIGFPADKALAQETLVFLNWSEYMDPELLKDFEKTYNIKVKEVYYETEEAIDQMLTQTQGKGYDLLLASRTNVHNYIKRKWLVPVDEKKIPNLKYIDQYWITHDPEVTSYAVPYLWGTVGIAYRKDLVKEKVTSWEQFFEPKEELRGKIMMIEDSRDAIGMALKFLGYSVNSSSAIELTEVEMLLLSQKPYVKKYGYLSLNEDSDLITGKYWMAMMYNGDALTLQDLSEDIEFVVPKEGTNIWLDCIMVMQASKKKDLAMKFINFLNEPKNAAKLAEYLYMATPNGAAKKLISKDQQEDTNIYPDEKTFSRSEFYQVLPPRVRKKYNTIFTKASYGLL